VAVVAQQHEPVAVAQLDQRNVGTLILQPQNRDTAAGIFLPLTYVRARDPRSTVVIYPSDHFVYPESRFLDVVRQAIAVADSLPDRVVLLGMLPDRLETDYGWILRGAGVRVQGQRLPVRAVQAFLEKPSLAQADAVLAEGALWNTFVMVSKVEALWALGMECVPDLMALFEKFQQAIGTPKESPVLRAIYQHMPTKNFSSDLLQRRPNCVTVMELTGVLWSDWGKPERIADSLRRLGKYPAFPLEYLNHPFAPIRKVDRRDEAAVNT